MFFQQNGYTVRFEWGLNGLHALKPITDVFIIVDVLSFSTCVVVAVSNGAKVYPYQYKDDSAQKYADSLGAYCAGARNQDQGYSLSPQSLRSIKPGALLVLPSPNGSQLSLETGAAITLAGCLRNIEAVAAAAQQLGTNITVIAAGERWQDNSMRFALEDYLGAGAIIGALNGTKSPEALLAQNAYQSAHGKVGQLISNCASGIELNQRGFKMDVEIATEINVSNAVPILKGGAYEKYLYVNR